MPELPEVEIVKRALDESITGRRVDALKFHRPDLRFALPAALPRALAGQRIKQVSRRGKYILAFAENGRGFLLHLGMSGVVRIEHSPAHNPLQKHDHVEFEFEQGLRVILNDARRFGFLQAVHEDDWSMHNAFSGMGPEPLDNGFNGPVLRAALAGRKGPIKTVLLDQNVVAGVGNIYACEALHMAGIHPQMAAQNLSEKACENLARAIQSVLKKAIEAGGSTLRDYRHADGKLGYFQHHFSVYDREGISCPRCACDKMLIQRIVQAGRSTFFCPNCQVLNA